LPPPPKYSPANEDADLWPTPLATPGVDAGAKPAQNHGEGRKPGDGEPKRRRTGWRGIVILIVFLAIIAAAVATVL
jgi:hypothetical protein